MAKRKGKKKAKTAQKKMTKVPVEKEEEIGNVSSRVPSIETGTITIPESGTAFQFKIEIEEPLSESEQTAYSDLRKHLQNKDISSQINETERYIKQELIEVIGNSMVPNGNLSEIAPAVNFDITGANMSTSINGSALNDDLKVESEDNLSNLAKVDAPFTNVTIGRKEKVKLQKSCEIVTVKDMHQLVAEPPSNQTGLPARCGGFLENTNNFDYFPAMNIKKEVDINDLSELNNSDEAQRLNDKRELAGTPSTSVVSSETACLQQYAAIQELASKTTESNSKQDNQNEYMQFSISDLKIKQELLDDQDYFSSTTPSFGFSKVNTVKAAINRKMFETNEKMQVRNLVVEMPETKFYEIQDLVASVSSVSDNSISSTSVERKENDNDCSKLDNSNSHQLLFSRSSSINSCGTSTVCAINSTRLELTNVESLLAEKKSSQFSLCTDIQKQVNMLKKDQSSDEITTANVTSMPDADEYSNGININNYVNDKQLVICQDLNTLRGREMGDVYNASTSLDSYPSLSVSPVPSLSTVLNENSNTNCRLSRENKEKINSIELNVCITTSDFKSAIPVSGNRVCESTGSEEAMDAIASPYFEGFASNWQLSMDDTDVGNENFDDGRYTEMALYLRAEGYKTKREDNSYNFCKRAMFESVCTKRPHRSDDTLLLKLYPDEVRIAETSVSDIQNHEIPEKKFNIHSIFGVRNDIVKVEPDCDIQNLETNNDQTIETRSDKIIETRSDQTIETRSDQTIETRSDQTTETLEIEYGNLNNVLQPEPEKEVMFNEEEVFLPELNLQDIGHQLSTETLQDIIKNAFSNKKILNCHEESCSFSDPSVATNNSMHIELVSSPKNTFEDVIGPNPLPSCSSKEIPNIIDDSDDSVRDDERYENSDDSDATVKNFSVDGKLSPKICPKENRISKAKNQSPGFGVRKKSRYEIIMERKEQEKGLQISNHNLRQKSELHSQTLKSTPSLMSAKRDQSTFSPTLKKSIKSQVKKLSVSKNKGNSNEKEKPTHKEAKTSNKRKNMELTSHTVENRTNEMKKDERSSVSSLVEMGTGNRFKNRNSSLFKDMTKGPQQPLTSRYKHGRQRVSHAHPNQPSLEEVHAQITETTLISVPPAKKKLSYEDYLSRKACDPPLHPEKYLFRNSTRTLLPNISQPMNNYPIQDPRLGRKQTFNHGSNSELMYIPGYHSNTQTGLPILNTSLQTMPVAHRPVSTLGHSTWNSLSSNEADISLPVGSIMNSSSLPHPNEKLSSSIPLLLPSSQTPSSDDMDLCSTESFVQHPLSGYFISSHGVQNFGSSTSFAPSQSQDSRLMISSPHPGMSVPSTFPPRSHLSRHSKNNESYELNLLPNEVLESIGRTAISSSDALMIVLAWTPIWLDEADVQPLHHPPPILGKKEKPLKPVKLVYTDMIDNFITIFPLMMYDLFFRIRDIYKDLKVKSRKYELDMIKNERVGDMMEIVAQMLIVKKPFPSIEGQLAIVTFTLMCGKKRDQFAYISHQKIHVNNPGNPMQQEVLKLNMKTMFGLLNVNKKAKLSMFVFYPLTKALNQIKALSAIQESPLRDIILKPAKPSCSMFILERIGTLSDSLPIMDHAVQKIKDSISFDDQQTPRVLLVDAPLGSDLMSTLIAVIDDVKKLEALPQKHRILICSRTAKRIEEIGLRLVSTGGRKSSTPGIQTVILAKSKAFSQIELKKLTLEDQVYQRLKFMRTESNVEKTKSSLEPISEEEEKLEAQRYVLGNCDVVLSNIVQCYDNVVDSFFGSGKDFQFSFCIIDESYVCTEPEAYLPLLYGIRKLILVGDSHVKPRHVAPVNVQFGYYRSLPFRINQCIK